MHFVFSDVVRFPFGYHWRSGLLLLVSTSVHGESPNAIRNARGGQTEGRLTLFCGSCRRFQLQPFTIYNTCKFFLCCVLICVFAYFIYMDQKFSLPSEYHGKYRWKTGRVVLSRSRTSSLLLVTTSKTITKFGPKKHSCCCSSFLLSFHFLLV